jgi:hypothetical protein
MLTKPNPIAPTPTLTLLLTLNPLTGRGDTLEVQMKNLTTREGTMDEETMQDSNQLALVQKVRVRVRVRVRGRSRGRVRACLRQKEDSLMSYYFVSLIQTQT